MRFYSAGAWRRRPASLDIISRSAGARAMQRKADDAAAAASSTARWCSGGPRGNRENPPGRAGYHGHGEVAAVFHTCRQAATDRSARCWSDEPCRLPPCNRSPKLARRACAASTVRRHCGWPGIYCNCNSASCAGSARLRSVVPWKITGLGYRQGDLNANCDFLESNFSFLP